MKHPTGIRKKETSNITYSNRGMALENDINASNEFYLASDIAVIHKKPTPVTITKVDYPSRIEAVIKEAYFKTPSTTDYNGIYKGKYIDFEAKETRNKTIFPLSNIHIHQIEHLKKVTQHGGIAFVIIRFTVLDETYFLKAETLIHFLETENRKSLPISYLRENGFLIKNTYNPRVDYLKVVETLYFGGKL